MYMYYKSKGGKVDFRFDGDYSVRVTDIDGLYPQERVFNTVRYADVDGVDSISSSVGGRTVTVGGDIKITDSKFLRNILKILNEPGELFMNFGEKKRKLVCRNCRFVPGERNRMYMKFVVVFYSDCPYFEGVEEESEYISKRENLLNTSFVLPCIFTGRVSEKELIVNGDAACEPVFEITCIKHADEGEEIGGIHVINETHGESIKLCTGLVQGEVVEIDVENRKITSSVRGNMIKYISDDTFLHKFKLEMGANLIKAVSYNGNEQIHVLCRYKCRYIEGVY